MSERTADTPYGYPRSHRILEITAITTFLSFALAIAWRLVRAIDGPGALFAVLCAIPPGYILADLISGTVHWLADRYGTVETPLFGPNFVRPFREHHVDPKAITRHDWIETNGDNCIVSFWVLIVVYFVTDIESGAWWSLFGGSMGLFSMLAIMGTNQIHKWAHEDAPPKVVRVLQRMRLILSPEHHDIHHRAPFETHYCITTGWLNGTLARLRFFQTLEVLTARFLGIRGGVDDHAYVQGAAVGDAPDAGAAPTPPR